MEYAELEAKEDERRHKLRVEAMNRGNDSYNKSYKER